MPPAYVKPYLKRQKNDAADAATGMGMTRPSCVNYVCNTAAPYAGRSM
jgi:hypothetical protein